MTIFSIPTSTLLALVCVALLLAGASIPTNAAATPATAAAVGGVTSSSSSSPLHASNAAALPSFLSHFKATVQQVLAPVADTVAPYVPSPVRELAPPFVHGAVSLVMIGRGARQPPASVNGAAGDELTQHTTAKFVYAVGAITAEIMLLKLVYREPYRNLRRNPMNRLLCSPLGFTLLVLLTAIPNDLVDTSLVCIFLWKLSAAVYTPAIVCGQLLRVYASALVPRLPMLSAAYTAAGSFWRAAATPAGADDVASTLSPVAVSEAWAEVVMAVVVAGAVLFCRAARRNSTEPAGHKERESDGDDYYEA